MRAATAEAADERPQAAGPRQQRLLGSCSQPLASWVAGPRVWQGVTPSGPNATRFVGSTATVWAALVGLSRQLEARAHACWVFGVRRGGGGGGEVGERAEGERSRVGIG